MKLITLTLVIAFVALTARAAPFDARTAFGMSPAVDLDAALKRAVKDKKRVFLVFWNSKEKGISPGAEIRGFAERQETKKLLKDHFFLVLLDRDHREVKRYIPEGNIEKAHWVLIAPDGTALKQGPVYANPDMGLKTVKDLSALP